MFTWVSGPSDITDGHRDHQQGQQPGQEAIGSEGAEGHKPGKEQTTLLQCIPLMLFSTYGLIECRILSSMLSNNTQESVWTLKRVLLVGSSSVSITAHNLCKTNKQVYFCSNSIHSESSQKRLRAK